LTTGVWQPATDKLSTASFHPGHPIVGEEKGAKQRESFFCVSVISGTPRLLAVPGSYSSHLSHFTHGICRASHQATAFPSLAEETFPEMRKALFHSETRQSCWQWGIWGCPCVAYSHVITILVTPHFWGGDDVTEASPHSAGIYISWIVVAGIQRHHLY